MATRLLSSPPTMIERLGIRARLVLASFLLTLIAGVVVERLTSAELEAAMIARVHRDLVVDLNLLEATEAEAAAHGAPRWDELARGFAARADVRVTLIDAAGRVIGDSGVSPEQVASLENHAKREEVLEANERGEGSAIRPSPTLGTRMIYVARRAPRPELGVAVIRLSVPLTEVDHALASARRAVAIGTAASLAMALALFGFGAHLLTAPIRRVTTAALRMADGELSARAPVRGKDEVAMLGRALNGLAAQLSGSIEELRDERDVLSGILDGMGEGVLLVDEANRVVLANRALRQLARFGDDAVGRSVVELLRSASFQEALEAAREAASPKNTSGEGESAVTREVELGPVLTRRLIVRVSRLPQGERGSLLAVFHDVTDLRRLETIRTDFVANVSHELRTPVTAISTAVETLLCGALDDPADAREFAEVIDRHSRRLRQLVDDLLDLAKIEAKGFRLALRDADVAPIVDQAARMLEAAARGRHVKVDAQIAPSLPRVHVDSRALEQVLSNLLDNAIKYGGEGATVRVAARAKGKDVEITVSDDGPGIPTQHVNRIFERFYRVDPGRSRDLGGTGLGLSIVKHLTELMHGSVEVESEPGRGATFRVSLPAAVIPP